MWLFRFKSKWIETKLNFKSQLLSHIRSISRAWQRAWLRTALLDSVLLTVRTSPQTDVGPGTEPEYTGVLMSGDAKEAAWLQILTLHLLAEWLWNKLLNHFVTLFVKGGVKNSTFYR